MKKIFFVMALFASILTFGQQSKTIDCGTSVQISATPQTGYHFVKWSDGDLNATRTVIPTEDMSLTAYFSINRFRIVFENYDHTILTDDSVDYGTTVTYTGTLPTKPATAQYTYTFAGWNPTISSPATADATYTAEFTEIINQYTITFLNWNGDTLESTKWNYGVTPSCSITPTRPADAQYTYTFTGWNKTVSTVTGDETYIAQYSNSTNSYTISVTGQNGTTTGSGTYQYGAVVTITAVADDCYEFVEWNDGNTNATRTITVTAAETYTATFRKIRYTVTVQSDDTTKGTVSVIEQ